MLHKMLHWGSRSMTACNENSRGANAPSAERPLAENVRALATGAALAASVDTSPAVLVSIYDYAHRFRDRPKRSA